MRTDASSTPQLDEEDVVVAGAGQEIDVGAGVEVAVALEGAGEGHAAGADRDAAGDLEAFAAEPLRRNETAAAAQLQEERVELAGGREVTPRDGRPAFVEVNRVREGSDRVDIRFGVEHEPDGLVEPAAAAAVDEGEVAGGVEFGDVGVVLAVAGQVEHLARRVEVGGL